MVRLQAQLFEYFSIKCARLIKNCPLNGDCLSQSIVYNAKIKTEGNELSYIGHTENDFKSRFRNHTTSFKNQKYRHATALSKKVWELKEKGIDHNITWSIIEKSRAYEGGSRYCNLCLSEKFHILSSSNIINKKSELLSKCRHQQKFLLKSYMWLKVLLVFHWMNFLSNART